MTIPQTFTQALELMTPLVKEADEADREVLLMVVEYMRSIVEAQQVAESLTGAALSNLELAIRQRDQVMRILSLWQENGTEETTQAAAEMYAKHLATESEGAPAVEDVQRALCRMLGFDSGPMPEELVIRMFALVDDMTRVVEGEKSTTTDIA